MTPIYGYLCRVCGQFFDGPDKHADASGHKCRDVTGSSSVPSKMGPVAESPWGPRGVDAEREWDEHYLQDQLETARGYGRG